MGFASLFAGKMLGDGYLNRTRRACRFAFLHSLSDKDYAQYCLDLFAKYLPFGSSEVKLESCFDSRSQKVYHRVFCQSRTSAVLDELYPLWYRGRKVIPIEWVDENLDVDGLAIWYQDDGHLKEGGCRIILSADSFSEREKAFLCLLLLNKFNIKSSVDCQGRLDISSRLEVRKFQALVEPLVHPSMGRKTIVDKWQLWAVQWAECKVPDRGICRTSIYLPYELYEVMRGSGYSSLLNRLLGEWLEKQWAVICSDSAQRYRWLVEHTGVARGEYMITPRFWPDVKTKLDLLSLATGFERSELVTIALMGL
ncbi:hypothetical protein [Desulfurispora thermophila]|uniref:hypothetical protein n=1 Tax=Desulfurispora thermophila TaxID=265470 RepID=UPI00038072F7|nr:hypothetical protein [Desulfurispora thermophila]